MEEAAKTFTVRAPIERVWKFLSDMEKVGSCVPGCVQVRVVNRAEAEWVLSLKIGQISRTILVRTYATEMSEPSHAAFVAKSQDMEMSGTLDLRANSRDQTEVTYRANVTPIGIIGKTIARMMGQKMIEEQVEEFARSVKLNLEQSPPPTDKSHTHG